MPAALLSARAAAARQGGGGRAGAASVEAAGLGRAAGKRLARDAALALGYRTVRAGEKRRGGAEYVAAANLDGGSSASYAADTARFALDVLRVGRVLVERGVHRHGFDPASEPARGPATLVMRACMELREESGGTGIDFKVISEGHMELLARVTSAQYE